MSAVERNILTIFEPTIELDELSMPDVESGSENSQGAAIKVEGPTARKLETDPWGNEYQYKRPGDNGPFDLFSYGADGQQGGEGMDRDIGNWK